MSQFLYAGAPTLPEKFAGLGAAPAWDPSALAAKTLFWLRADSLVTGTTWTDKTNGIVFTGTTVTQDSSGLNGQKRIVFPNALANTLTGTVPGTGSLTKGQIFVVGNLSGSSNAGLWNISPATVGFINFGGKIYENAFSTTRQGPFTSGLGSGGSFVYEVKADNSGNVDYRVNGSSVGTFTGNVISWQGAGLAQIGADGGGTYMIGEIEEIIALNDNLTSGEHTSLAGYLSTRYGVTL